MGLFDPPKVNIRKRLPQHMLNQALEVEHIAANLTATILGNLQGD